jgi:hypothetical protein
MDAQDRQDGISNYHSLTRTIIACSFEVINEIGAGFLESVYEKALLTEHQAQTVHYLKATGIAVGLLINFGPQKLDYKRFTRTNQLPSCPSMFFPY